METSNSDPNQAVLHAQMTGEVWDPYRLVIPMLITLFCMRKTIGEVRDPYRLLIMIITSLL